jgi:hypothetical protein
VDTEPWQRALAHVASLSHGRPLGEFDLTVHFHPDRLVGGVPLLRHLADDGVYRSQFETGTSNGGLTAYPGGDRWRWEHRLFGGAYDDAPPSARPKYGSLNYRRRPAGGSVRFGSAHFRLSHPVRQRTTFCYPDSFSNPADFGTADHFPLLEIAEQGEPDILDDHIEAHVHGPLRLAEDVAELVLDPSFAGTGIEVAAKATGLPLTWHHGFRLTTDVLVARASFYGPALVRTGLQIAEDGVIDARIVGDAAAAHDPQTVKQLWHCVARFGA